MNCGSVVRVWPGVKRVLLVGRSRSISVSESEELGWEGREGGGAGGRMEIGIFRIEDGAWSLW